MKTLLTYIFLISFVLPIHAQTSQDSWMKKASIWKSYSEHSNQVIEKDHLSNMSLGLSKSEETIFLNYHALTNNAISIKDEIANLSKMTLFVVYWSQDTTQEQLLWSITDNEKDHILSTTHRLANLDQYQFLNYVNQAKSIPQIQTYFHNEKSMPLGSLTFGQQPMNQDIPVENFSGSIAEVILFKQVLPPLERQKIQTYLALKYGITLSENYISTTDNLLKKIEDSDYPYRISGLARNDFFQLYQKQAQNSLSDISLAIGLNTIEPKNAQNNSILSNDTYLIWSDNNKALQYQQRQILEIPSLERLWEMSVSGDITNASTELQIDLKKIEFDQDQNLYLVIYEDENKQQKCYYQATEITKEGIAIFKNIKWDSDQSGEDYFSFAIGNSLIPNIEIQFPQCDSNQSGQLELAATGGQPPYRFQLNSSEGKKIGTWKLETMQDIQMVELAVGEYQLTLTDKNGSRYEETFFFQAADAPVYGLQNQYFLAENTILTLNAELDNLNANYQWRNETGQVLSDQSWLSIKKQGVYQLILEDEGCISKHFIEIFKLNEARNILAFELSPNPSTDGSFKVKAQFDQAAESRINVYNLKGQLLKSVKFNIGDRIDYQDNIIENGAYLIELQTRKTKQTKKLIVQLNR